MKSQNWSKEKAEAFYNEMKNTLCNDPFTRLSEETTLLVNNKKCVFDVHCHIFDKKTLKIAYILLRMTIGRIFENENQDLLYWNKDTVNIYNSLNQTDADVNWDELDKELEKLEAKLSKSGTKESLRGKGLKDAIRVLKKDSMEEIFDFYYNNFSLKQIEEYNSSPFVTSILMMDLETGWNYKAKKTYSEQVDELNNLAIKKPILPFLAVDPRRAEITGEQNLYTIFKRAFTENNAAFFGIKCYPALGYFPNDKRLEPIFALCEEFNIPVTTHCGGESVSTFEKSIGFLGENGYETVILEGDRRKRARYLNDPSHWIPVLEKFPNLKLNLAHFGTDIFWKNHINTNADERILKLIELLNDESKKVFTDFSYNLIETDIHSKLKEVLNNNPKITDKIMYGTDFWVVLPHGDLLNDIKLYLSVFQKYSEKMVGKNTWDFLFG